MQKGEVWWATLPEPIGKRPVVLLSRSEAYYIRNAVTIAEVTSSIRNIPVEVELGPEDGLPKKCVVNLDTIVTVKKELLQEKIATLSREKIAKINEAVKFALNL